MNRKVPGVRISPSPFKVHEYIPRVGYLRSSAVATGSTLATNFYKPIAISSQLWAVSFGSNRLTSGERSSPVNVLTFVATAILSNLIRTWLGKRGNAIAQQKNTHQH